MNLSSRASQLRRLVVDGRDLNRTAVHRREHQIEATLHEIERERRTLSDHARSQSSARALERVAPLDRPAPTRGEPPSH